MSGPILPILGWLPKYSKAKFQGDLTAGLTTAVLLVPQAMAYAMLAGMPPINGLYAALLPLFMYGILGGCPQLAIGPAALDSLLVGTSVGVLATVGSERYIALALTLALLVGVIQISMGFLRMGAWVNLLSRPVISGFTTAAALMIMSSQLSALFGFKMPNDNFFATVKHAIFNIDETHVLTLSFGLGTILLVRFLKRWKLIPGALVAMIIGTLLCWGFDFHEVGVAIVGEVPAGLPSFSMPAVHLEDVKLLLPAAITLAFVGFMEAISVGKALAAKNEGRINANGELFAFGAANLSASFSSGFVVSSSFGRTAVNAASGAQTPMAGMITSLIVIATLLFFTQLFYFLPQAVLGGIILSAVTSLIDIKETRRILIVEPQDFLLLLITMFATLGFGVTTGIMTGVAASLLWLFVRATKPHLVRLGRLENSQSYRSMDAYPEAEEIPGLLIVRMDAQFFYGNIEYLIARLERLEEERGPIWGVIIDGSGINQLDSSADYELQNLVLSYHLRNILVYFAHVKGPVRKVMARSGLATRIGPDGFTNRVCEAVERAKAAKAEAEAEAKVEAASDSPDLNAGALA